MALTKEELRIKRREKYLKYKAQIQAHGQLPHIKAYQKERHHQYYKQNKEKFRAQTLSKRYGLSYEEYLGIIRLNEGKCPICLITLTFGSRNADAAVVDHCHDTGEIRGVVCNKCNRGLGLLGDSKEILINALKYLENVETI